MDKFKKYQNYLIAGIAVVLLLVVFWQFKQATLKLENSTWSSVNNDWANIKLSLKSDHSFENNWQMLEDNSSETFVGKWQYNQNNNTLVLTYAKDFVTHREKNREFQIIDNKNISFNILKYQSSYKINMLGVYIEKQ